MEEVEKKFLGFRIALGMRMRVCLYFFRFRGFIDFFMFCSEFLDVVIVVVFFEFVYRF